MTATTANTRWPWTATGTSATIWPATTNGLTGGQTIWLGWNTGVERERARTAEEERAQQIHERRYRSQMLRDRVRRREADRRAAALLAECLTDEQARTWDERHFFDLPVRLRGEDVVARIRSHLAGNIEIIGRDNQRRERWCVHVVDSRVPVADNALAQKLRLEADADALRRLANRTPLFGPASPPIPGERVVVDDGQVYRPDGTLADGIGAAFEQIRQRVPHADPEVLAQIGAADGYVNVGTPDPRVIAEIAAIAVMSPADDVENLRYVPGDEITQP